MLGLESSPPYLFHRSSTVASPSPAPNLLLDSSIAASLSPSCLLHYHLPSSYADVTPFLLYRRLSPSSPTTLSPSIILLPLSSLPLAVPCGWLWPFMPCGYTATTFGIPLCPMVAPPSSPPSLFCALSLSYRLAALISAPIFASSSRVQ